MTMNQKNLINIIVITAIVILAGVAGYFVFKKSGFIVQQPNPIPIDETANWRIYTNQQYGFELKYPLTWVFYDKENRCDSSDSSKPPSNDPFLDYVGFYDSSPDSAKINNERNGIYCTDPYLMITISTSPQPDPILPLIKEIRDTEEPVNIGGVVGTKYSLTHNKTDIGGSVTFPYPLYIVTHGDYNYRFDPQSSYGEKYLVKILSTFKFIEPTTTVSTSKSSTCKQDKELIPIISSLSTYSASVGDTIKIHGCNLNGLEGDKSVWIENSQGVKGLLEQYDVSNDPENMQVTLTSTVCKEYIKDTKCTEWLTLTPGIYKIYGTLYHAPDGKKSNEVTFTIK